jgi:hypothetical protein
MKQNRMYERPYAQTAKQKCGAPASSRMGTMVNLYQQLFACRCGVRESRVVTRST